MLQYCHCGANPEGLPIIPRSAYDAVTQSFSRSFPNKNTIIMMVSVQCIY